MVPFKHFLYNWQFILSSGQYKKVYIFRVLRTGPLGYIGLTQKMEDNYFPDVYSKSMVISMPKNPFT